MRILLATGIYPPDVGGPARYVQSLERTLRDLGHEVSVLSYKLEKRLPFGARQILYFARIFFATRKTDVIIAFDTVSVGFPTVVSSFLWGKKIAVRIGGDFLWEAYLERKNIGIPIVDFYQALPALSFKEKVIIRIHQFILDYSDFIVFSTSWQRDLWSSFYIVNPEKIRIIENCYYPKRKGESPKEKIFLAAGRQIALKNFSKIEEGFERAKAIFPDIKLDKGSYSTDEYEKKLKSCFAVVVASFSEISPNSIIEAIAYNKPFILTKYNGILNRLNGAGVIVDPNDVESLAKGFCILAYDETYKDQIKDINKLSFVHSFNDIAKEFVEVLSDKS